MLQGMSYTVCLYIIVNRFKKCLINIMKGRINNLSKNKVIQSETCGLQHRKR